MTDEAVQPMSVWQAAKVRKLSVDIETAKFKNAELYKAMLRKVSARVFSSAASLPCFQSL